MTTKTLILTDDIQRQNQIKAVLDSVQFPNTRRVFFYYRFNPGEDPPELETLLEALVCTTGRKRRDILRSAFLGGAQQAQDTATKTEGSEIASTLDEMFGNF